MDSKSIVKNIRNGSEQNVTVGTKRSTGFIARAFLAQVDEMSKTPRYLRCLEVLSDIATDPDKYGAKASIEAFKEMTVQADVRPGKRDFSDVDAINRLLSKAPAPVREILIKALTTETIQSGLVSIEDADTEILYKDEEIETASS